MKKWWVLLICLVGLDVLTKALALHFVPPLMPKSGGYPFGGIPVFECSVISFSLNTIGNSGAAWGLFQGHSGLLFALRCAVIGALLLYLVFSRSLHRKGYQALALWLIAAGAVGNAIDYVMYGSVVDFLHFCFWQSSFPIFNLADSCITVGAMLLLFLPKKPALNIVSL